MNTETITNKKGGFKVFSLLLVTISNDLFFFSDTKRSMDSKTTRGSGWQHIRSSEDETYVMIFDVYILYEDNGKKSAATD